MYITVKKLAVSVSLSHEFSNAHNNTPNTNIIADITIDTHIYTKIFIDNPPYNYTKYKREKTQYYLHRVSSFDNTKYRLPRL